MEDLAAHLEIIRSQLFEERSKRVRPLLDNKILTNWNGLMIAALAFGGRILDEPEYVTAANRAADFILERMISSDNTLLHSFREGKAHIDGQLDDYAFLIYGLFELYEATFGVKRLRQAINLTAQMRELFWDEDNGGFYGTRANSSDLPFRQKQIYDGAVPSGNSVAALNLIRLGRLVGDTRLEEMALKTIKSFGTQVNQAPSAYTFLMLGITFSLGSTKEAVICGVPEQEGTREMMSSINGPFLPGLVTLFLPADQTREEVDEIVGHLHGYRMINQSATAYVCVKQACRQPTTDAITMLKEILGRE